MAIITKNIEKYKLEIAPKLKDFANRKKFVDAAFGILKKGFGKKLSVFYVSKMRKSWRS